MISYSQEARIKLQSGINKLADAVGVTLGPKGRNVIIKNQHITKDGVTVARAVRVEDELEQLGIDLIKQTSIKTCDDAGDGTSTSCILAQAIINEGIKQISAGHDPIEIKQGLDECCKLVVDQIKDMALDIGDNVKAIASISANNDEEIGELIDTAIKQVGVNGIVTVEESSSTYVSMVKGATYMRGYISPFFANNSDQKTYEYENVSVLIVKGEVTNLKTYEAILSYHLEKMKPIVMIADKFDPTVLDALMVNKARGLKVCPMIAPSFKERRTILLNDLGVIIGANSDGIGQCEKVIISKEQSTFINGIGTIPQELLEEAKDDVDRYSKLTGGVSVVYVGGNSELEMKEKKDRVDDALCATKSAIEEGVVVGGGFTYLKAKERLLNNSFKYEIGARILLNILDAPLRKIISNAGKSPDVIIQKSIDLDMVYDAKQDTFGNNQILDSAKVSRVALENAVSVAGTLLTTECVIC